MIIEKTFPKLYDKEALVNINANLLDASDWFFVSIGYSGGVASNLFSEMLSSHPDVFCGNEEGILDIYITMFKNSKFEFRDNEKQWIRYIQQESHSLELLRNVLEVHRKYNSNKKIYGDLTRMTFRFPEILNFAFPKCKIILLQRNLLDILAIRYDNCKILRDEYDSNGYYGLYKYVKQQIESNRFWIEQKNQNEIIIVPWKSFFNFEDFNLIFVNIFKMLNVNPDAFDYEKYFNQCNHKNLINIGIDHEVVSGFTKWCENNDNDVYDCIVNELFQ